MVKLAAQRVGILFDQDRDRFGAGQLLLISSGTTAPFSAISARSKSPDRSAAVRSAEQLDDIVHALGRERGLVPFFRRCETGSRPAAASMRAR
jgi:hypothetical protein